MHPKLLFKHSFETDKNAIWFILGNPEARLLPNYLPNVGIELMYKLAKKRYMRLPKKVEREIETEIKKRYRLFEEDTEKTITKMEVLWRPFEKEFFNRMENLSGEKWKYNTYVAYVSPFSTLNSYFGSDNKILIEMSINWERFKWTIAHELIHLLVYERLKRYSLSESERILVGELAVEYILFEDPVLKKHWPNQKYVLWGESKDMWKGIAPKKSLMKIKKEFRSGLDGRFDKFLEECIGIIKTH